MTDEAEAEPRPMFASVTAPLVVVPSRAFDEASATSTADEADCGVLLQQHAVFFPFTVRQVVEMGRAPWLGTDRELAVAERLDVTETVAFANRHVPSLSRGERARVAFACVLAQRTGILLLDEPTAAPSLAG